MSPKVYVCTTCGRVHQAFPFLGFCNEKRPISGCRGIVAAARVCANCEQWAWATRAADGSTVYRCLNDCEAKGLTKHGA